MIQLNGCYPNKSAEFFWQKAAAISANEDHLYVLREDGRLVRIAKTFEQSMLSHKMM